MTQSDQKLNSQNEDAAIKKEYAVRLLLKDYDYLADSIWKNEQLGETRISFYLTFVSAVLAGLFSILNAKAGILANGMIQFLIFVFSLFGLLVLGTIIFLRIIHRNSITNGYKRALDQIRTIFENPHFSTYQNPALFKGGRDGTGNLGKAGGLAYIIAAINSLIGTLFFNIILFSLLNPFELTVKKILLVGFLAFISFFLFYCSYIRKREKMTKKL